MTKYQGWIVIAVLCVIGASVTEIAFVGTSLGVAGALATGFAIVEAAR